MSYTTLFFDNAAKDLKAEREHLQEKKKMLDSYLDYLREANKEADDLLKRYGIKVPPSPEEQSATAGSPVSSANSSPNLTPNASPPATPRSDDKDGSSGGVAIDLDSEVEPVDAVDASHSINGDVAAMPAIKPNISNIAKTGNPEGLRHRFGPGT